MKEFYVLTKYSEGNEISSERFSTFNNASLFMRQNGRVDGPEYAIIEVTEWHRKKSSPHWMTRSVGD